MLRKNLKFKGYNCYLDVCLYPQAPNKNIALVLKDMEDDGAIAKITVNPEMEFPQTHACIKDYLENDGMLQFVKENGIVVVDDTAKLILMCSGSVIPCLRIADDIYKEYLKVFERFNKEMGAKNNG